MVTYVRYAQSFAHSTGAGFAIQRHELSPHRLPLYCRIVWKSAVGNGLRAVPYLTQYKLYAVTTCCAGVYTFAGTGILIDSCRILQFFIQISATVFHNS